MTEKIILNRFTLILIILGFLVISFESCTLDDSISKFVGDNVSELLGTGPCPCIIDKPVMQIGSMPGSFSLAGICLDVINCTEKELIAMELFFLCTEVDGTLADLCGSNPVMAQTEITFSPGERKSLVMSLDGRLKRIPEHVWEINPLLITAVTFADGTVWRDMTVLAIPLGGR